MSRDPILDAFDHLARRRPQRPLVASPSERATVGDVDHLARRLEARLAAEPQLVPGTPVAFSVRDGVAFLASFLATRRRGLVPVLLDWRAPSPERGRIVDELGCRWLLLCETSWPRDAEAWRLEASGSGDTSCGAVEPVVLPPDVAAVKLSSGSSGRPRGIVTPAAALHGDDAQLARSMGLAADERILTSIPMSHSYGLASIALPALVRGSLVVLADEGSGPFGTLVAGRALDATFFPTVPAFLGALVRAPAPPRLPESLRLVITAGAPLPPETAVGFRRAYGFPVRVFYGSSETGGICFDREGSAGERGTVGEPIDGVRIELAPIEGGAAGEHGAADAADATGIVTISSPAVASGYWPEPHGRLSSGRFESNDLGRWNGGELELLGRIDDLINVRGKKVNPREVEDALAGLPGMREVVALGTLCPDRGETSLRVVVAGEAERIDHAAVVAWCRSRLAEHKVPRSVVVVDEIPRTARGKVDREMVRRLAARRGAERVRTREAP